MSGTDETYFEVPEFSDFAIKLFHVEQFELLLGVLLQLQHSKHCSNGNRFQCRTLSKSVSVRNWGDSYGLFATCIEENSFSGAPGSIWNPMFSQSYHLLEREFNETAQLLAGHLDADERNQMTQRLLTIILEGRELAKILEYPTPNWSVIIE